MSVADPMRVLPCCPPAYGHVYPSCPSHRTVTPATRSSSQRVTISCRECLGFRRTLPAVDRAGQAMALEADPALADLPADQRGKLAQSCSARSWPAGSISTWSPSSTWQHRTRRLRGIRRRRSTCGPGRGIPAVSHALVSVAGRLVNRWRNNPCRVPRGNARTSWADPFVDDPCVDIRPRACATPLPSSRPSGSRNAPSRKPNPRPGPGLGDERGRDRWRI
jgi:hypothetical protein